MVTSSGNEKSSNQMVSKLMLLLDVMAESRVPMRLQEIAERLEMPPATVLRYLNALAFEGYVYQDTISDRYALTWKIFDIGERVHARMNLRTISQDIITTLTEKLAFGICLVVEHDMECMYLDCVYEQTDDGISLVRIGKQTPLNASSSGKILLTGYTETELKKLVETRGLPSLTARTITDYEALVNEIERVKKRGYALDDEECEEGLRCVAVPIYGYLDKPMAAISAFGPVEKLTDEVISDHVLPLLREAAGRIGFRIGKK